MATPVGLGAIRLEDQEDPDAQTFEPKDVEIGGDVPEVDPDTATKIETADGGVVIYIGSPRRKKTSNSFDVNLAEDLEEGVLGQICDELLQLIDQDNTSRKEWLETRARGIEIMGLKIEPMRAGNADGSAPLEGMSNARATLLAEAVIRFGANAFAELCPSDGPAKVTEVTAAAGPDLDDLADALETDLNDYLLNVDKPYVPDTDAMLLRVGSDGSVFKKVYHDPILRRPISRAVYGEDLIIDNSATSLYDAKRITHRVFMGKSMLRRMQLVGAYCDVPLGDPGFVDKSAPELASEEIGGVHKNDSFERDDRPYELYECYCELDIKGEEHETDGEPDGLAVPYKVVIHKELRKILEIRRNWDPDDEMCLPKTWFVQYPFIRGFGVYGIGLSHLLGNITNGITAAWREFIDAGMFNNFPGGVCIKGAMHQNTNIIRAGPGAFAPIETSGQRIQDAIMPFPYKGLDAVFVQFIQQLESTGQRLGGTAEVMVGEGRQDAPVGTTLALIEQAIKPLLATHKRLCGAQSDELQLLVERFREDPQAFWRSRKLKTALDWDESLFLQAINSRTIVTRADPNTASHLQRMLRNAALYQMAKDDPPSFNLERIRTVCIRGIGFADPAQYLNQNPAPPAPDPKAQAAQLGAQADLIDAQTKAKELEFKQQTFGTDGQKDQMEQQTKLKVAGIQLQREQMIQQGETQRTARQQRTDAARAQLDRQQETTENQRDRLHEALQQRSKGAQEQQLAGQEHAHAQALAGQEQAHDLRQSAFDVATRPAPGAGGTKP